MSISQVTGAVTTAGCAVLILTGCGLVHPSTGRPVPVTGSASQQQAEADAASIVASFVPPKDAVLLDSPPSGLIQATVPGSPDLAVRTAYWQASGSPKDVLTWEKEHLPSRFTWSGSGTSSGNGPAKAQESFTLPAATGALPAPTLEITAAEEGSHTAIRVDAQVPWLPSRPSSERIPASAHAVTRTANPGFNATSKPPAPVTSPSRYCPSPESADPPLSPPTALNQRTDKTNSTTLLTCPGNRLWLPWERVAPSCLRASSSALVIGRLSVRCAGRTASQRCCAIIPGPANRSATGAAGIAPQPRPGRHGPACAFVTACSPEGRDSCVIADSHDPTLIIARTGHPRLRPVGGIACAG